jgi:hypothetical protein
MDTKKVVLAIALCLVLVGALSGCVGQTQQNNETNTSGTNTNGGGNGGGDNGGGGNGNTGTAQEIDVDTENMTVECGVQEGIIKPEDTQEVDNKYSDAGPAFDPRKAEAMLHRELNELRTTHGNDSIEPLLCDPNLREIAQEHSRVMEELDFTGLRVPEDKMPEDRNVTTNPEYGNLSVRYEGVCRGVTESYGRWLYQRNRDIDWEGDELPLMQRDSVDVIQNHEELVRDMRGVWFSDRDDLRTPITVVELRRGDRKAGVVSKESMEYLTDASYTRQGIGMHINRSSREVFVTQVLC